ncbi:heavy metal translocating P-type ATPase [Gordonibacter sp. Marseille-P4307]|uniref:heavy metal translocating P-type ATPase n=1 Tax=Gordonibacter sp. Marseille-P4307 TaxID=2161815 RepID=UPI000F51E164|nr:heavy metal translocating P-type ATPase [Gordonibacter sp. Marseille-P4307]
MTSHQKKTLIRIVAALALFICLQLAPLDRLADPPVNLYLEFALFLVPYLLAGYDVIAKAWHGITHGQVLDENFLMTIATFGAFALVLFPESDPHMAEGAAVMLFYQLGEWFQSYAVGKSRKSIAAMMDIAPDYANLVSNEAVEQVDPYSVNPGDTIVVKPGERVPLDGTVTEGSSQLDTSALTGESVPRVVETGAEVISGCINMTGPLHIRVERPYDQSTVQRILELVENASDRKARTENFITRFARYYTPVVVGLALVIACIPPLLLGQLWSECVKSALIFLVVSCPCALVISVPLSFFGGIGAASRAGILVKGSNYLEALASAETVAFDKTGTLTNGTFSVVAIHPAADVEPDLVLSVAAHAEVYSNHPIALSLRQAYSGKIDAARVDDVVEKSGHGIRALVDQRIVVVGNDAMMGSENASWTPCDLTGTVLHVLLDGAYIGHIVIADMVKEDARKALDELHRCGVKKTVMLTGDRAEVASAVADDLGIDEFRAHLLPADKVNAVEDLLASTSERGKLVFVGDGINDAPVLMRSDVGVAMGALGSDAAIEAADIVLMDDRPSKIALAIRIARKTMRIVKQNIAFAIGVKVLVMVLALPVFGIANMWMAVFGDVGVSVIAILNAMRALRIS